MTARESSNPLPSAEARGPLAVDRDAHPRRCRARSKRSGQQCRAYAVEGMSVCRMHGGSSPQAREAAQRRKAEREATALLQVIWDPDAAPITNPVEALQKLAGQVQHAVNVLGAMLQNADLDGPTAAAWARAMRELRQVLEGMERLDLAGKHIELQQQQAQIVTSAFVAACEVVQLLPADKSAMVRAFLLGLGRDPDRPALDVVRGEVE